MTLTELLPAIQKLSVQEKIRIMRILAEEIDREAEINFPFDAGKVYQIATPYETVGAGKALMDALQVYEAKTGK